MRLWVISPSPTFITFEEAANAGFMEKNMDAKWQDRIAKADFHYDEEALREWKLWAEKWAARNWHDPKG